MPSTLMRSTRLVAASGPGAAASPASALPSCPASDALPPVELLLPLCELLPPVELLLGPTELLPPCELELPPVELELPPVELELPPVEVGGLLVPQAPTVAAAVSDAVSMTK
jgi:hypothetical protein